MYTVKEAAKLLNLTEHTIRYYTDRKLVPHLKRDKNNNRLFDDEALNWLLCAKFFRHCGMSIEDIKRYIDLCLEGESTIKERYNIMIKQRDIAQAQLEEAKKRAKYIEEKTNDYYNFINGKISDDVNLLKWKVLKNEKPLPGKDKS